MQSKTPIVLGYEQSSQASTTPLVGFMPSQLLTNGTKNDENSLISYSGEAHLTTIASTGSGKTISVITPTLLTNPSSAVVFDPKGEQYFATAKQRLRMGHEIIAVNPFGVPNIPNNHHINPFDTFSLSNAQVEQDSQTIATFVGHQSSKNTNDPFWENTARGGLSGLIAHVATSPTLEKSLKSVYNLLFQDDVIYGLAQLLDSKQVVSKMAYAEIASLLQMPDVTRGGVLAVMQSFLKNFMAEKLLEHISRPTSFNLQDWITGEKPITIYIVIPPYRMNSHSSILKMYFYTLMMAAMSRTQIPTNPTLFILDEASLLGSFDFLRIIHSVGRGYGIRAWSFWQSFSQLKESFPNCWSEIIDNCGVIQLFGQASQTTLHQFMELSGLEINRLKNISSKQQLLLINGTPTISKRFNYLEDELFVGKYSPNPYYTKKGASKESPCI